MDFWQWKFLLQVKSNCGKMPLSKFENKKCAYHCSGVPAPAAKGGRSITTQCGFLRRTHGNRLAHFVLVYNAFPVVCFARTQIYPLVFWWGFYFAYNIFHAKGFFFECGCLFVILMAVGTFRQPFRVYRRYEHLELEDFAQHWLFKLWKYSRIYEVS